MKISTYDNRTAVTFNIEAFGDEFVMKSNAVKQISKKHNAQYMLFGNRSHLKQNLKGEFIGYDLGNSGGTITFHSHSCDHKQAAQELIDLLISWGYPKPKYFTEVIKTHRADGTPYKVPQQVLEEVK